MTHEPPSGRQHTIVHGSDRATVVEVRGGLRSYLTPPTDLVDTCELQAPRAAGPRVTYLPTDDRGTPTGTAPVTDTEHDFRTGRAVGDVHLDLAFTDLDRDGAGRAWVRLCGPPRRSRSPGTRAGPAPASGEAER